MALNPSNSPSPDTELVDETAPVCVLVFNASDPSGAGGLSADIATIASVGGHPLPVVTGAYARDSAKIFEHFPFDDERSEEHTSELQSPCNLVCRLLLEKKKIRP